MDKLCQVVFSCLYVVVLIKAFRSVRSVGLPFAVYSSVLIYSFPCLIGFVPDLTAFAGLQRIDASTYIAWSIFMIGFISFDGYLQREVFSLAQSRQEELKKLLGDSRAVVYSALLLFCFWAPFVVLASELGVYQAFLAIGKSGQIDGDSTTILLAQLFMRVSCGLMVVYSLLVGDRWMLAISIGHQIFQMTTGDRTGIVMSFAAYLVLLPALSKDARMPWRLAAAVAAIGALGALGKHLYIDVASVVAGQDATATVGYLRGDIGGRFAFPFNLEPFGIMAVTDKIIYTGYEVDSSYLFGWWAQLLPVSGPLGYPSNAFYTQYQPDLFPSVTYGLAYSWIGEGYAVAGYAGVAVWILIYFLGLWVHLVILARRHHPLLVAIVVLSLSYWIFYAHRNSLFSLFAHCKQVWYIGVAVFICGSLVSRAMIRRRVS